MADPRQVPPHRYIKTENIRAGDVILEEEVWMWSFLSFGGQFEAFKPERPVCHYCFQQSTKLLACSGCKSALYCGTTCQRMDWSLRHKHGECNNLNTIRQKAGKISGEGKSTYEIKRVALQLIVGTATTRLQFAERDGEQRKTPLWQAFLKTPNPPSDSTNPSSILCPTASKPLYGKLVAVMDQLVKGHECGDREIELHLLRSLVLMRDYEPWKQKLNQSEPKLGFCLPQPIAYGMCMEMAKYLNDCNPNAVIVNDGRIVRMIALENISNPNDVRPCRDLCWLYETRCRRRTIVNQHQFGYYCNCARCNAGDSAEPTLFALRCPKWAEHYESEHGGKKSWQKPCDGVVTGLRRSDISTEISFAELAEKVGRDAAATADDPRPHPDDLKNAPAYIRASCQKCNARYDHHTMHNEILIGLSAMYAMSQNNAGCSCDYNDCKNCLTFMFGAEQYVYPTNYVFIKAKQNMMNQILLKLVMNPPLEMGALVWLKRKLPEKLAQLQSNGFKQTDLLSLYADASVLNQMAKTIYATKNSGLGRLQDSLRLFQHMLDDDLYEMVARTAKVAVKKLKELNLPIGRT